MRQPLKYYIDLYNMVGKTRVKADYRFSKSGFKSLLTHIQWDKEDAVKQAMKAPELEVLKAWRFKDIVCEDCRSRGWFGGAAMTTWQCPVCKTSKMHGSTATPQICTNCAISSFKCQRCLKSLDEDLEKLYNHSNSINK